MSDMSKVIVPKSDQINADDLLAGPQTIRITSVKVSPGTEQPVSIYFEGSDKAYRCCKSMARVLVTAWGADSAKYVGRSMTLYCDPKVKWGGMEVGGIRISHMSDIAKPITLALTMTRANKKPFTVQPLSRPAGNTPDATPPTQTEPAGIFIDAEQQDNLCLLCKAAGIEVAEILKRGELQALSDMSTVDYDAACAFLQKRIDRAKSGSQPSAAL
jgi:hypothetical protein